MILKHLEVLYNFSFSSGTVPDAFKIACVIPVYKAKSCLSLTNYRPISLLSIFTQILEKLMYNRLIKYVDKHNIIFSWQFGFRVNHSTEHQDAKKVSFTACHSGQAFRQAVATVSVKIVGTLLCLLVPSVLVYTRFGDWTVINNFERDKGSTRRKKTAFGLSVPTIFVWDCVGEEFEDVLTDTEVNL